MNDEHNALAQLTAAHQRLAEARDITEVMGLHAMASAVEVLARQARMGTAAINMAQEVKLLCERKLADAVDHDQQAGTLAQPGKPSQSEGLPTPTFAQLGLTTRQVAEARAIRDAFTEDDISQRIADATARDREVARSIVLRDARYDRAHKRKGVEALEDEQRLALMPPTIDLRVGDFTDVLGDVRDVDAIITDPPYPREHLHVYGELAAWADDVLTPDGVLVVLTGHMFLPDVLRLMEAGARPYRWMAAYMTPGAHATIWARRVIQGWKPLLIYGGGPRFHDVFRSSGDDKSQHYWGQNLDAFTQIVEAFTRPGQLVADPFLGGGTTAAACLHTQRRFVGCDIDADSVDQSRERIVEEAQRDA